MLRQNTQTDMRSTWVMQVSSLKPVLGCSLGGADDRVSRPNHWAYPYWHCKRSETAVLTPLWRVALRFCSWLLSVWWSWLRQLRNASAFRTQHIQSSSAGVSSPSDLLLAAVSASDVIYVFIFAQQNWCWSDAAISNLHSLTFMIYLLQIALAIRWRQLTALVLLPN